MMPARLYLLQPEARNYAKDRKKSEGERVSHTEIRRWLASCSVPAEDTERNPLATLLKPNQRARANATSRTAVVAAATPSAIIPPPFSAAQPHTISSKS